jgi:hypothetical protein
MTSNIVFNNEDKQNCRSTTRHFDVVHSEEDDEDHQRTSDEDLSPPTKNPIETFDDESLNKLYDDWLALDAELRLFETKHKEYVGKLDEVESLKTKYRLEFDKYKKKLDQLQKDINRLKKSYNKKGIEMNI